jgi:hypothetical protein
LNKQHNKEGHNITKEYVTEDQLRELHKNGDLILSIERVKKETGKRIEVTETAISKKLKRKIKDSVGEVSPVGPEALSARVAKKSKNSTNKIAVNVSQHIYSSIYFY